MPRKKQSAPPEDLYSLRQLSSLLKIDRNRLAKKLATLKPVEGPNRSRLYSLSEVEDLLAAEHDPQIAAIRLRKLTAEAALAELKLNKETGEFVSIRELHGDLINLFRAIYIRVGHRLPREIAAQLFKAESPGHITDILRIEVEKIFRELRDDHQKLLIAAEGVTNV